MARYREAKASKPSYTAHSKLPLASFSPTPHGLKAGPKRLSQSGKAEPSHVAEGVGLSTLPEAHTGTVDADLPLIACFLLYKRVSGIVATL